MRRRWLVLAVILTNLLLLAALLIYHRRRIEEHSYRHAKEVLLRNNLDLLRKTIDAYTYDKRKAPQSLEDLVSAGYLKKIPIDPMTNRADWKIVMTEHGINDVKSGSQLISTEGTAYNTW